MPMTRTILRILATFFSCGVFVILTPASSHGQQTAVQMADSAFDTSVAEPAYPGDGPIVVIDEAHANFHTSTSGYEPLAELLRSDGYTVVAGTTSFDERALADVDVLVIANARSADQGDPFGPAFTEEESDAVRDWVEEGGALLLIADHAPFGSAAQILAERFGVTMGKGWVFAPDESGAGITTQFVFSRENGRLGAHPILSGRGPDEAVARVRTFSGQSLSVPDGATPLLTLASGSREVHSRSDLDAIAAAVRDSGSAADLEVRSSAVTGPAQGIAMTFGEGRVVVLGEAAMLSAQLVRFTNGDQTREIRAGMNVPGYDNRQFALNTFHWLTGLIR